MPLLPGGAAGRRLMAGRCCPLLLALSPPRLRRHWLSAGCRSAFSSARQPLLRPPGSCRFAMPLGHVAAAGARAAGDGPSAHASLPPRCRLAAMRAVLFGLGDAGSARCPGGRWRPIPNRTDGLRRWLMLPIRPARPPAQRRATARCSPPQRFDISSHAAAIPHTPSALARLALSWRWHGAGLLG